MSIDTNFAYINGQWHAYDKVCNLINETDSIEFESVKEFRKYLHQKILELSPDPEPERERY